MGPLREQALEDPPRDPDHSPVLADLDPELNGLALGIPAGYLGEPLIWVFSREPTSLPMTRFAAGLPAGGSEIRTLGPPATGRVQRPLKGPGRRFFGKSPWKSSVLVFGKKAGLDPQKIYEVVRVSTGSSVRFENRVPRMLALNFVPGGTIDISYKDQELETTFAKRLGVPLLLANVTQRVYQMARAGLNKEDGSSIIRWVHSPTLAGL